MKRWMAIAAMLVACGALAQETLTDESSSNRTEKKLGLYLAVHDPSPAILGINAAYSLTDYLRLSAGFGKISVTSSVSIDANGDAVSTDASATIFGGGITALVPGWNVSPAVGLHFATISYSGSGLEVGGFQESGSHFYGSLGVDWQSKMGLNLSAGYNYSFKSGIGGNLYLAAGWFVDWLG
jgi:hypothetical protein